MRSQKHLSIWREKLRASWKKKELPRFWSRVNKTRTCWLWTSHKSTKGYGRFHADNRLHNAHRWLYEKLNGPIKKGLLACHRCDVPLCVRPSHIYIGTLSENALDAIARGQHKVRFSDHCPKGHSKSGENAVVYNGHTRCRLCRKEAYKRFKSKELK